MAAPSTTSTVARDEKNKPICCDEAKLVPVTLEKVFEATGGNDFRLVFQGCCCEENRRLTNANKMLKIERDNAEAKMEANTITWTGEFKRVQQQYLEDTQKLQADIQSLDEQVTELEAQRDDARKERDEANNGLDEVSKQLKRRKEASKERDQANKGWSEAIMEKDAAIKERDELKKGWEKASRDWGHEFEGLQEKLRERDAAIKERGITFEAFKEKNKVIAELHDKVILAEKDRDQARMDFNKRITTLEEQLLERDKEVEKLKKNVDQTTKERDESRLEFIKRISTAWVREVELSDEVKSLKDTVSEFANSKLLAVLLKQELEQKEKEMADMQNLISEVISQKK